MFLPIPVILQELETTPTSIIPILRTLHYQTNLINEITKSELKHLVSRSLNLAKSSDAYNKWCGVNLIKVLSKHYPILSSDGLHFVNQLVSILEAHNGKTDPKILSSTADCLNYVCDRIRGKPTLTREILTPKLPTIIGLYLEKIDFNPYLLIKSLNHIMKHHPTTFRPFGNKLKARLLEICSSSHYLNFPQTLKDIIGQTVGTLPIIEKTEPESKWADSVNELIVEVSKVLLIYNNFLNFNDDADLLELFKSLPQAKESDSSAFTPLNVNVDDHNSILLISTRVQVLLDLLRGYLTNTSIHVRVPLGHIIILNEIICSINTRFISYKREIRDEQLKKLIESSIIINHSNSVKLLTLLPSKFRGNVVPHLANVLSILETLIPFKNKKISFADVLIQEELVCSLLACVEVYLSLLKEFNDNSQLLRFIEVALFLVEPRITNQDATNAQQKNGVKGKNKKKNSGSVPLADILSHQHLFKDTVPQSTIKVVRSFINSIICRTTLPPTQYYRIMRYLLIEAVQAKSNGNEENIPQELKSLLIDAVLYPANERSSLLPIVASIMGNDPLISVFCNPRFPPLPIHIKEFKEEEFEEEEVDEEEPELEPAVESPTIKRRKLEEDGTFEPSSDAPVAKVEIEETTIVTPNENIFASVEIQPEQLINFPEPSVTEQVEEQTEVMDTVVEPVPIPKAPVEAPVATVDDDSDFEMPDLDAGDSDSDED